MEMIEMAVPWSEYTSENQEFARVYLKQVYSNHSPDIWISKKIALALGYDAHRRGLRQQAKQWFEKSNMPDALNALGSYAFSEKQYETAYQYWQQGARKQEIEGTEEPGSIYSKINYVIMLYGKRQINRDYAIFLLSSLVQRNPFLHDYIDAEWCFDKLFSTPEAVFDYAGSLKRLIDEGDDQAKFMELFFTHHMILSNDQKKDWDHTLKIYALRQRNLLARKWLAELFWKSSWGDVDYMLCASFLNPDEYLSAMWQKLEWRKHGLRICFVIPFIRRQIWHLRIK